MGKKILMIFGGIIALLFVPGTIPALVATKTAKHTKARRSSKKNKG